MESIKKKMQFSLAMLLSLFVTVIFSIIFALAAQQASINGMITISYRLPATLISGSDFNNTIPEDCSSIIFDYASQYPQITSSSTMTTKTLDTKDLGLNAGGISSYYDQTNKTLYVLSNYEILANPDCSNMFMFKTLVSSITFNNFNTSNVTNLVGMFQYCASLTELDLSGFNSTNATNMAGMFYCCSKLTKLT